MLTQPGHVAATTNIEQGQEKKITSQNDDLKKE